MPTQSSTSTGGHMVAAYPQILTTDLAVSQAFYVDQLGFATLYEYGEPPFYALLKRGEARLNLRFVHHDVVNRARAIEEVVLAAYVPVVGVKDLYLQLRDQGVTIVQRLTAQPRGVSDFLVADPDWNRLCFAEATDHDHTQR